MEILSDGRLRWVGNSMIVAVTVTISNVFFDSLVGYTLAKFQFRGRYVVFVAILSTLMIPTEMLVLPWYIMSSQLGWLDSYWGIMFPGMMTAFGTFLMKQFFEGVPNDFLEAARIDGLNEFAIWWKIAMPLVRRPSRPSPSSPSWGTGPRFWPLIVDDERRALYAARRPLELRGRAERPVGEDHDRREPHDALRPSSCSCCSSATSSGASCSRD